jgi:hypothetical protein
MNLRIHGDNILECEHALDLIEEALSLDGRAEVAHDPAFPLWSPVYTISNGTRLVARIQLLPGYGRWPADIQKELNRRGAPLREMPDAIITELLAEDDEEPIAALEFCGALPAGNNAWQRCGRALNLAYPGIPFFYFAELGGAELNASREVKAGRTPNPLIPFAYLALGDALKTLALPVFEPSPSIRDGERDLFGNSFGRQEAVGLLVCILKHELCTGKENALKEKDILAIETLVATRKDKATVLTAREWGDLAACDTGATKATWLAKRGMTWRKKINIPKTATLAALYEAIKTLAVSVGTRDFAICLVPAEKLPTLENKLRQIYDRRITPEFIKSIAKGNRPLVVVWIAGFKPRGDDSRPDRGLLPLARMLFGEEDVNVLSVIYGPAKNPEAVINDPSKAAKSNGLWESIVRFSTAFLLDSTTSVKLKMISAVIPGREKAESTSKPKLPASSTNPIRFGENDVDSALHTIFARMLETLCFECICNPPGGDWSGFSLQMEDSVHRWTSLPRVTATKEKRPDHVIQFRKPKAFLLSIESKDGAGSVEPNIGPRLEQYVKSLLLFAPTICRGLQKQSQWNPFQADHKPAALDIVTAAAFQLSSLKELDSVLIKGKCDVVFGFEFDRGKGTTTLHLKANGDFPEIKDALHSAASRSAGRLIIHIH